MKRNENPNSTVNDVKKVKQQESNNNTSSSTNCLTNNSLINNSLMKITNLSKDEIRIILSFLKIGEILFLSFVCKEMYQQIVELIQQQHFILFSSSSNNNKKEEETKEQTENNNLQQTKLWSITRALKEMKKIKLNSSTFINIMNYLNGKDNNEENNENLVDDLSIISNKFIVQNRWRGNDITVNELMELLTFEQSKIKSITVDSAIEFEKQDDRIRHSFEQKSINFKNFKLLQQVEICPVPIGFTLKKFKLNAKCSRFELYKLLSNCINLEYLYLCVENDYYRPIRKINNNNTTIINTGRGKGGKGLGKGLVTTVVTNDDEEEEKVVVVPLLKQLKELHLISCYDYDTGSQFVIDLLKLSPNLENFNFVYHDPPTGDELLHFLIENCKHLKKFYIAGDDGATPCPNSFSDSGILKLLQNITTITELSLQHCNNISGQLFNEIGKYAHNLEQLFISRDGFEAGFECDLNENLQFGGEKLLKLKSLTLSGEFEEIPLSENFFKTLYECAPNLTYFNIKPPKSVIENVKSKITVLQFRGMEEFIDDYLNCENLESLTFDSSYRHKINLTENALQNCKWKNLKTLKLKWKLFDTINNPKEWLITLLSKCPNLEFVEISDANNRRVHGRNRRKEQQKEPIVTPNEEFLKTEFNETIIEILKEEKNWPNLYSFRSFTFNEEIVKQLKNVRPLLLTSHLFKRSASGNDGNSNEGGKEEFYCQWLYGGKLKKEFNCSAKNLLEG
ncbi:hypothetical protein ABK040_000329 [Willaertia magna]